MCDLLSVKNSRGNLQILDTPIGAGADDRVLHRSPLDFRNGGYIIHLMGLGNLRAELVQIDLDRLAVYRVIIRGNALDLAFHAAVKPFAQRVIAWHQAAFSAQLDHHVGDRHAFFNRQCCNTVAAEFQRLVVRTVRAQQSGQIQNNVLGIHPFEQTAFQHDPDRFRNAEP